MSFVIALVTSLFVIGVPAALIMVFRRDVIKPALITSGILMFFLTGINFWVFWGMQPVVGFTASSWFDTSALWIIEMVLTTIVLAAGVNLNDDRDKVIAIPAMYVVGVVLALFVSLMISVIWTDGRAKQLANHVYTVDESVDTSGNAKSGAALTANYPNTATQHIVLVPEQVARRDASAAMSQGANLSTNYQLQDPILQSIKYPDPTKGHAYWVVAMAPANWTTSDRLNGQMIYIPGYILVDAENPDATPMIVTKDTAGKVLDIRYSTGGSFSHKLERYVWDNGYAGQIIDNWTLEVNDQLQPFWTATINQITYGFRTTIPQKVITVNAQSGAIDTYALDKVPAWIDRIYSADTATTMLNWWGDYAQNSYGLAFRNNSNRYKAAGDPVLVYTTEDYPVWQYEVTSINSDTAVSYIALFDGRWSTTGSPADGQMRPTVRLYKLNGTVALSSTVATAIQSAPGNLQHYSPTHIALHKIDGVMTWVAPLVPNGQTSPSDSTSLMGVALVQADKQLDGNSIVIGTSMSDALNKYASVLSGSGSNKPVTDSQSKVTTGVVDRVSAPTTNNTTGGVTSTYCFMLKNDEHVYQVTFNPQAQNANLEVPFITVGAKVSVSYLDTGAILRTVSTYDDAGIKIHS